MDIFQRFKDLYPSIWIYNGNHVRGEIFFTMTVDLGPLDLLSFLEIVRGEMRRKNDMDDIFFKKII